MALLVPAILAKSTREFTDKVSKVAPFCPKIQVDIMDGLFVENKTIGYEEIPKLSDPNIKLELHMMTKDPLSVFQSPKHPSVSAFIFHYEAVSDPLSTLKSIPPKIIRGIALNPETPANVLEPLADSLDLVLLMSVHPGFDGQQLISKVLDKVPVVKALRPGIIIEMDGGINNDNASVISAVGVDQAVVGSHLFETHNVKRAVTNFMLSLGDMRGVSA